MPPKSGSQANSKVEGKKSKSASLPVVSFEELPPLPPAPIEDLPPLPPPPSTSNLQNQPFSALPGSDLLPPLELPALPANDSVSTSASPGTKDRIATKKAELSASNVTPKSPLPPPLPADDVDAQLPPLPPALQQFTFSLSGPEAARPASPSSSRDTVAADKTGPYSFHDPAVAAQDALLATSSASINHHDEMPQKSSFSSVLSSPLAADSQQNGANFRLISPDLSSPVAHGASVRSSSALGTGSFSTSVGSVVQKFKAEQNELVQVLFWPVVCDFMGTSFDAGSHHSFQILKEKEESLSQLVNVANALVSKERSLSCDLNRIKRDRQEQLLEIRSE